MKEVVERLNRHEKGTRRTDKAWLRDKTDKEQIKIMCKKEGQEHCE